jgi:TPR repeat protein
MIRRLALLCFAAALAGAAAPAMSAASEPELRAQLEQAMWPADIVRLAGEYRRLYPRSNWVATADVLGERAGEAARILGRKDVRLYRSSFSADAAPALADDLRRAALGDSPAAVRIAHAYMRGEAGVVADTNRYVGWMQFAAMLGNDEASYELAVHYRRNAQIPLASLYEARAVELGFVPPRDLDNVRK